MYELIEVGSKTYYIDCPAKMGLYRINEKDVCLIDSGNHKDTAKKVLRIIEEQQWNLTMIINTHSHADHIGGNEFLQQRTGCKIYTGKTQRGFTEHTILEPAFLFGAYPPKVLRGKGLMAKDSMVEELTEAVLPVGLTMIPLDGHTTDQFGIGTDDDVIFLADALVGENILDKYKIAYVFDVSQYLATLEAIKELKAKWFIPSHGKVERDVRKLAELNIASTEAIMKDLLAICVEKQTMDDLVTKIFDQYGLCCDLTQYYLNSVTLKAMVSYLYDSGKLDVVVEENRIYWKAISI